MAKKAKKSKVAAEEATLRAELADTTPFRLRKRAKTDGVSPELIEAAEDDDALIDLIVAKEMGNDAEDVGAANCDDDDDEEQAADSDDDDNGDGDDDGDGDDSDDGDGDDGDGDDDDDDDDEPVRKPTKKAPVKKAKKEPVKKLKKKKEPVKAAKSNEEDLMNSILDQVASQGAVIDKLDDKLDHLITVSGLVLRTVHKCQTLCDKAFGRIFKQNPYKGIDKVRAAATAAEEKIQELTKKWAKEMGKGESD